MLLVGPRERELIVRIAPVLIRAFEDLAQQWTVRCGRPPAANLPAITRAALEEGVDRGLEMQLAVAERLVASGVPLHQVVSEVLIWDEVVHHRLVRDADEDVFATAAALTRFAHELVLLVAEGCSASVRVQRDEVKRGLDAADRLKSEITSMISHDLKTPLTTIQACASALMNADDTDESQRRRFLDMILQNSDRLTRLITRIVDLSRIEARALDLSPEPLNLAGLARRLADGILPAGAVRLELPDDLPLVRADRDAMERILVNLMDNAIRFSPSGEPVRVRATVDGAFVELRVVDLGPGVPKDRRQGLFSKFYQVDPSPSGHRSGSGLGLAIVRGLSEAMGGDAGYLPNQPAGSVFWVRLPVAVREPA
ncbi:MAG TPA: ATP-binding protein [Actinomycetota bacterium]|nr:ATP-binding protein [Actinomycetota bacterium]